jgi:signal transduction histidine kinase
MPLVKSSLLLFLLTKWRIRAEAQNQQLCPRSLEEDQSEANIILPALWDGNGDKRRRYFSFFRMSIRLRLPLLIGLMLFFAIAACTFSSYREVKRSAIEAGRGRVQHLSDQAGALLHQSAINLANKTLAIANAPEARNSLQSPSPERWATAASALLQFTPPMDKEGLTVELRNPDHSLRLALPDGTPPVRESLDAEYSQAVEDPSTCVVGALRIVENKIIYPIVAVVKNGENQPLGFLVRWRRAEVTEEARRRVVNLFDSGASLYIGSPDGKIWTDLVKVAPAPPIDVRSTRAVVEYHREGKTQVMALARPISGASWILLAELPKSTMLDQANRFLWRVTTIGAVLLVIGVAGAFALSRSITQPIYSLKKASTAIAAGNYSCGVDVRRGDELGSLAQAFNIMTAQVRDSQSRLEQKVLERTSQLEAANHELEAFSYSVSHDLRAPLRAIDGFSRILLDEYGPELQAEAQQHLLTVKDNAQRMGRLIDDLLNLSRLGRQSLVKQSIAPAAAAHDALKELNLEQDSRQVGVRIDELPVCQADPALLKQVYVNLLSNALKYSSRQAATVIEAGFLPSKEGGGPPVYFVKDNGVGFDMRYVHKLFGVFQRLHRAEEYEGTGVGLAIVQRIIQRHGGRIWAEGEPGRGATFYFTLEGEVNV